MASDPASQVVKCSSSSFFTIRNDGMRRLRGWGSRRFSKEFGVWGVGSQTPQHTKGYFLVVGAGMSHCCYKSKVLEYPSCLYFILLFSLTFIYLCIYLFIYIYICSIHHKHKAKQKNTYICISVAGKTLWISQQQPSNSFAISTYVSGDEMGKHRMSSFSVCILGQVWVLFLSLFCASMTVILSEGWLNVQHTEASVIKAANCYRLELGKTIWRKWNVKASILQLVYLTIALKMYKTAGNVFNTRSLN